MPARGGCACVRFDVGIRVHLSRDGGFVACLSPQRALPSIVTGVMAARPGAVRGTLVAVTLQAGLGLAGPAAAARQPAVVRGVVLDTTDTALPGVRVYVRGDVGSVVTGADGRFELVSGLRGRQVVVAFLAGFRPAEHGVDLDAGADDLRIVLDLAAVTETVRVVGVRPPPAAPSTERLTALDVVRVPGSRADVLRALQDVEGVTQVGDGAGLFVRGGNPDEVLVLLDGAVLHHPYRYETAAGEGGAAGTVDPFLLEDVAFSSGGFPARYGNVLSAVIDMQGLGRPTRASGAATAGLAGVSGRSGLPVGARGGVRASGNWIDTRPLFALNGSRRPFSRHPNGRDLNVSGHYDSETFGSFKVLAVAAEDEVGVELEADAFRGFLRSTTANRLYSARWERAVGRGWLAAAAAGWSRYERRTGAGVLDVEVGDRRVSWRADLSGDAGRWLLRTGADGGSTQTAAVGFVPTRGQDFTGIGGVSDFDVALDDRRVGAWAEIEGSAGVVVPNLGVRIDRFRRAAETTVAPRLSLLVPAGDAQRVRMAWGLYHQAPPPLYYDRRRGAARLPPMRATHWVFGYEYGADDGPFAVRLEAYRKRYRDLPLEIPAVDDGGSGPGFSAGGHGSAAGVDVSARGAWPAVDVRVTYGWLRAARRWTPVDQQDRYDLPAGTWTPDFSIPHNLRLTALIEVTPAVTFGVRWRTASGRPWTPVVAARLRDTGYEPVFGPINSRRAPRYGRLDLSVDLLTNLGGAPVVLFGGVTNVLDRYNVLAYAWSPDFRERRPVTSATPRAVYVGISVGS